MLASIVFFLRSVLHFWTYDDEICMVNLLRKYFERRFHGLARVLVVSGAGKVNIGTNRFLFTIVCGPLIVCCDCIWDPFMKFIHSTER